jgi:hypothetical protein
VKVGDLRIDPVVDGNAFFTPTVSFKGSTEELWNAHPEVLYPSGAVEFGFGGFVVRGSGDGVILVDTGTGELTGNDQFAQTGQLLGEPGQARSGC